ncbi:MAG: Ger(x)C family spore germination protein [Bacillota bacterium]
MKSRMKKTFFIFILVFMIIVPTGCFDRREIDDMAYPIALGFEKGKTNTLRITLQLAVPTAIGGGGGEGGGGGGGGEKSVTITTVETPTIYSGLNMLNTFISKQINLSHAKALVFSRELAEEGIEKYIHALIRGREFRPNAYILVSRGSAEEFIRAVKPQLEANPAKYYELMLSAYRYTGFTADTQLVNFYHKMESTAIQPIAVLTGLSKFETSEDFSVDDSTFREKGRAQPFEGDFKAGDMTKVGDLESEFMGLAVFDGSKMVGELDGEETTYHLMVEGKYGYSFVTIPDPKSRGEFVLLSIKQSRSPEKKVKMVGGKPNIDVKLSLEADILSIQSGINYESSENIDTLEKASEDFIKEGVVRYLNRTAKTFGTDVCGFGMVMKGKFLTWDQWIDFGWHKKYRDSTFDVNVDLKIRRPGLIIRTIPAEGTQGEGRD